MTPSVSKENVLIAFDVIGSVALILKPPTDPLFTASVNPFTFKIFLYTFSAL